MLRLPQLAVATPETVAEAAGLLAELGDRAVVAAGGTDLIPNLKRRQLTVETVVLLGRLDELHGISPNGTSVRIGARTTLREIADSREVPAVLAAAAAQVASPTIRNQGTIGGNLCIDTRCFWLNVPELWRDAAEPCLKADGDTCWVAPAKQHCWAVSSSDLAPVLIALDATVTVVGAEGARTMPAADLYVDDGIDYLAKRRDEIITAVDVPVDPGIRATYQKLRRRGSIDFPILGVAAAIRLNEAGGCTEARIVLGAVASAPLRVTAAEDALVGNALDDRAIAGAAEAARLAARPLFNTDLTSRYRKRMVPVFVTRALEELAAAG